MAGAEVGRVRPCRVRAHARQLALSLPPDGDLVETTLLRFWIPDDDPFRPELVKRLSEALPRTLVH
jgi:hypothetical protein